MPVTVVCSSCNRSWDVTTSDSVYLELELLSRPCPACEAYTLGYRDAAAPRPAGRVPRPGGRRLSAAGEGGGRRPPGG